MLHPIESATLGLLSKRILQLHITRHGTKTISTMSAIKKGLRKSDSTNKPRMRDSPVQAAERPRFTRRDTFSRTADQPPRYSEARIIRSDAKTTATGRGSSTRGTTFAKRENDVPAGASQSYSHSRGGFASKTSADSPRPFLRGSKYGAEAAGKPNSFSRFRKESGPPMSRDVPRRPNPLRLEPIESQEQEEEYDNTHRITKVVQYDAAEEKKERRQERVAQREARDPTLSKDYVKIQRSTAASEFIYGRSSVLAALKLGNRRLYKLYIARSSEEGTKESEDITKYALNRGTPIVWVTNIQTQAEMDRISKSRPHNGVILEASPLPKLPVKSLKRAHKGQPFEVEMQRQSIEEEQVNGNDATIPYEAAFSRYPFVVMLDEIVDQGNLGGILRSAYFLGADAVILSSHMAALNTVALKAASGAAEGIKLLSVHNTTGFLQASKENGWKVFAAVAPPAGRSSRKQKHVDLGQLGQPLQNSPCILLLGNEGEGLRRDLISLADQTLSITGQRHNQSGVDSLNVSVAAGVLMGTFLKEPGGQYQNPGGSETSASADVLF